MSGSDWLIGDVGMKSKPEKKIRQSGDLDIDAAQRHQDDTAGFVAAARAVLARHGGV